MVKYICALLSVFILSPDCLAEKFVNFGINVHKVSFFTGDPEIDTSTESDVGYHFGVGFRNQYGSSQRHYLGAVVESEEILGDFLIGFRPIDYQYQLHPKIRLGTFFGVAQLDTGAAQTGYYLGGTITVMGFFNSLDLVADLRYADGLGRDRLLDEDPQGEKPDMFLDFVALAFYLNWRF